MKRYIGSTTVAAFAVTLGMLTFTAPAANANSGSGFEFEVVSTSKGVPTANTTLTNTQQTKVNGADQVLWQESDYKPNLSSKSVKKAYKKKIKVKATGANSSRVIYKSSKHNQLVVLKTGSKFRNTGKHNQRRAGFVQTVTKPTVVKYDKKSKQYRHAADLLTKAQVKALQKTAKSEEYKVVGSIKIGSKRFYIVTWCGNYIGGKVVMLKKVIQVRFQEDLLMESSAESVAKAEVTIGFKVTCPDNGATFTASGSAWAYGRAYSKLTFSQRTRATTIGELEYRAKQNLTIDQNVQAEAQASIKVSGTCGSGTTPPPPVTPKPMFLEIDTINDVLVNNTRTITPKGTVASGHTAALYCTAGTGTITSGKSQTVNGNFSAPLTYKAGDEPGTDKVSCTLTQDDGQTTSISTNTFEIRSAPIDPM